MTAGKGIQHSEMFPLINPDNDNPLEIFQIWLNLPSYSKMVQPYFKMLWREDIPVLKQKDDLGRSTQVQVISGNIFPVTPDQSTPDSWASTPEHFVGIYTVEMSKGASWVLPKTSEKATRSLFFYQGNTIVIQNETIQSNHLVELNASDTIEIQNGSQVAKFLILEGLPIAQPVVQYGPFVMNSQQEIIQAKRDYGKTQFGGWPWVDKEVVHPREKGRFALYVDGTEELKGGGFI